MWKIFGQRLDGFSNDDYPSESEPGKGDLVHRGQQLDVNKFRNAIDVDFVGSIMPPPEAVNSGKAKPLADEDRRTLARWIDLGCPIDLDYRPAASNQRGEGWMLDDQPPTLAVTLPLTDKSQGLDRILIGMDDFYTGLDESSLLVRANNILDGIAAGQNLANRFVKVAPGVWQWKFSQPLQENAPTRLSVSVRDKEGNITRIERTLFCEER